MHLTHQAQTVEAGIDALLAVGRPLQLIVADYLSDAPPTFTGRHFHTFGDSAVPGWRVHDLAAAALLDTPIGGVGVERLLISERDRFDGLLDAVPGGLALWDDDDASVSAALESATRLYTALRAIHGIGSTRAHKLIARKRPRLHPVYDSVVRAWFVVSTGIRYQLAELVAAGRSPRQRLRDALDPDRTSGLDELRLLDIAVWMCGSPSPAARHVRQTRGVDGLPSERLPARATR